ncbi:hypothetical protein CGPG_00104 [Cellulophaga phage phiST]|nr:hypothetical protein CGPG_00104 [Cellulophaga phage phiST]AGH56802.1 hypothetical protein CGPG_00104 [Cellulophaga phage phiST]
MFKSLNYNNIMKQLNEYRNLSKNAKELLVNKNPDLLTMMSKMLQGTFLKVQWLVDKDIDFIEIIKVKDEGIIANMKRAVSGKNIKEEFSVFDYEYQAWFLFLDERIKVEILSESEYHEQLDSFKDKKTLKPFEVGDWVIGNDSESKKVNRNDLQIGIIVKIKKEGFKVMELHHNKQNSLINWGPHIRYATDQEKINAMTK